jgi:Leucine-rich repeat (LRR) protein
MKYIKLYENFKDIDIFDEEDWDEIENDGSFLTWLNKNYPDKNIWKTITYINCFNNKLENLNGIENLINLQEFNCTCNEIISLNGIKNLTNLKSLYCYNNKLINLNEIENCTKLKILICENNNLTDLNGIEKLTNLERLYCSYNNFSNEYKEYLKNYCKEKNIKLYI